LLRQQLIEQQRRRQGEAQQENVIPVLKPGDTVLLDIILPTGASSAPTTPSASGTNGAGNEQGGTPQGSVSAGGITLNAAQLSQLQAQNGGFARGTPEGPLAPVSMLSSSDRERLQDLVDLIRAHNPYELDSNGQLLLPGIPPISLAGLTEDL